MPEDSNGAANHTIFPNNGAAGDAGAAANDGVVANVNIVSDLY